jgi:hypothetical protein
LRFAAELCNIEPFFAMMQQPYWTRAFTITFS